MVLMGALQYLAGIVESAFDRARQPAVVLDESLAERFLRWSSARNSTSWVRDQRRYLYWWVSVLAGRDIRFVSLERHILPALEGAKARGPRIATLKRLCSWLVYVEHRLPADRNPCLGLKCIQATPAQWKTSKVVPRKVLLDTRRNIDSARYRAALDVLRGTGWHVSELQRFATSGELAPRPPRARPTVAGVLVTRHKLGETIRTPVTAPVLRAARVLLRRRGFCASRFAKALRDAARAAGHKPWGGGGRMRHTFASNAIERGATPEAVAAVLNHRDKRTTMRFYAVHVAPDQVPPLL